MQMTVLSHHGKVSLIVSTHTLWVKGETAADTRRQFDTFIIFHNRGDARTFGIINSMLRPGRKGYIYDIMDFLAEHMPENQKYLFFDNKAKSRLPQDLIFSTNLIPSKGTPEGRIFF